MNHPALIAEFDGGEALVLEFKSADTSRHRGGFHFVEKWTNARAALVGFLTGRGYSSVAISEVLGDGTSDSTVRRMWQRWGITAGVDEGTAMIALPIAHRDRAHLAARAAQRGLSIEEYCRRILIAASMPVDRFDQLTGE